MMGEPMRISLLAIGLSVHAIGGCQAGPRTGASMGEPDLLQNLLSEGLPPGNVRLQLERLHVQRTDRSAFTTLLRYRDPNFRASVGSGRPTGGLRIFAMREGWSAALGASQRSTVRRERHKQFIVLAVGTSAWLEVVRSQQVAWPFRHGGRVYQVTGSLLRVKVLSADARSIRARLEPHFRTADGRGGRVRIESLTTTVELRPDATHLIMADQNQTRSLASGWLGSGESSRLRQTALLVTAEVGREKKQ